MTKKNRLIASVFILVVIFAVLLSVGFVISEADHDCIGDGCPICCQITVCKTTLRSVGFAAAAVIFFGVVDLFAIALPSLAKERAYNKSLVSLRVKLSN